MFICQHGNGAVATWDGKEVTSFCSDYKGRPFNSPNDIVISKNNSVFFSDPPYGLKDQQLQPDRGQDKAGFYCWQEGAVHLITDQYQYPNGLCLSKDEKSLFTCSNKPFEKFVLEFDTTTLKLKRQVANESSDGIKIDKHGNLYLCTKEGLVIIDQNGNRIAKIELETIPANACWGGRDENDLFITARNNIFLIKNLQKRISS